MNIAISSLIEGKLLVSFIIVTEEDSVCAIYSLWAVHSIGFLKYKSICRIKVITNFFYLTPHMANYRIWCTHASALARKLKNDIFVMPLQ